MAGFRSLGLGFRILVVGRVRGLGLGLLGLLLQKMV